MSLAARTPGQNLARCVPPLHKDLLSLHLVTAASERRSREASKQDNNIYDSMYIKSHDMLYPK